MPHPVPSPATQTADSPKLVIQGPLKRRLAFLSVTDPLDFATTINLIDQVPVLGETPCCLMIDLEHCEGVSLSAFRALLRLDQVLDTAGGELRLVVPPYSRINTTLAFFGSGSRLQVYPTLREACAGVTIVNPQVGRSDPGAAGSSRGECGGRTTLEAC